jgi:pyruvate/2-oxoglutarate dehydrogenase complex dihydrolipoamide dehydrogenase (E3) component
VSGAAPFAGALTLIRGGRHGHPEPFNAIMIGAGQSGNPLPAPSRTPAWKVALAERAEIGGTCVNWGCTPTKTMIASARVACLA